jgi:hypothetical protein
LSICRRNFPTKDKDTTLKILTNTVTKPQTNQVGSIKLVTKQWAEELWNVHKTCQEKSVIEIKNIWKLSGEAKDTVYKSDKLPLDLAKLKKSLYALMK